MKASAEEFFEILLDEAEQPIEPLELVYPKEVPIFEKYDEYIPEELIRKGFAYGVLDIQGMLERIREWKKYKRLPHEEKKQIRQRWLYEKPEKEEPDR